ncbi:MAG: fumarylacetoacetate hydrolase family protein [Planctomycetaceae bacterium]|nr:fumarylacetoacetate hydrolase family protein [Planctomycetaceae bacterium]
MKFATYTGPDNRERVGALSDDDAKIIPLEDAGLPAWDMRGLIEAWSDAVRHALLPLLAGGKGVPLNSVKLDAPIPHPRHDILCIGQNYLEHALESARYKGVEYKKPEYPMYFSKRVDRAVGPGGVIPAHDDITDKLDYEAELAVVIGKRCDHLRPEDAYSHIFGYTIVNDVSARDIQLNHVQFMFGKGLDGFTPMGPWIVTADEFATPPDLLVSCFVNGEKRQAANTSEFIFDIPFMLSQLSAGMALEPGDILITGTPSGVGMGFQPPRFLHKGDVVECRIEGIGSLVNTVG